MRHRIEFLSHDPSLVRPIEQTKEGWWVTQDDIQFGHWVKEGRDIDHNPHFSRWCSDWISPGTTVLDIGSNIGIMAVPFLRRNPGLLICAEPLPTSFECLKRNLLLHLSYSNQQSSVVAGRFAIGREPNLVNMTFDVHTPGVSHIDRNGDLENVEMWTLDQLAEVFPDFYKEPVSFMKIDVEGYEGEVLLGGQNFFQCHRPPIIFEVNNVWLERAGWNQEKLFDTLSKIGYRPGGRWPPSMDSLSFDQLKSEPQLDYCWVSK